MNQPKLKVEWYRGSADEDEKKERKETVLSGEPVLKLLRNILKARLKEVTEDRKKRKLYDSPNWALVQADLIGAERTLEELVDLLTIEAEEE